MGLREAWRSGEFTPGWDGLANYTLGDPRFSFYPPVSLCLGALLSTILPVNLVPAAFIWFSLVLSALCMHAASKSIAGDRNGTIAAILYMISPYVLVTSITRFAVAELLVLAWMPLILLYFLRTTGHHDKRAALLLGCLLALTWMTNLPASIVLIYVLFFVAAITTIHQQSVNALLSFITAEFIAILAAAFYVVPVFFEKEWITASSLLHQNFRDFFVFGPISGLHRMRFQLGLWIIALLQIAVIAASIVICRRKVNSQYRSLCELAAVAFLFELPVTTVLWLYLPEIRYIQFPFRFLSIIGAVLPLIITGNGINRTFLKTTCCLMALMALLPLISYLLIKPATSSNILDLSAVSRHGYSGTVEYVPAGALVQNTPIKLMPVSVDNDPFDATCKVAMLSGGPRLKLISVDSHGPCRIKFATYFYPYWVAADEAGNRLQTRRNDAGLLVVTVPAGQHTIQLRFQAHSVVRMISMAISLVTFTLIALGLWKFPRNNASEFPAHESNLITKAAT